MYIIWTALERTVSNACPPAVILEPDLHVALRDEPKPRVTTGTRDPRSRRAKARKPRRTQTEHMSTAFDLDIPMDPSAVFDEAGAAGAPVLGDDEVGGSG